MSKNVRICISTRLRNLRGTTHTIPERRRSVFSEPYGQQLFSRLCTERANRDRRIVHRNEKTLDSRNGILYRPVLRKSRRGVPSGNVAVGEETNIVNTGRETSGERAARFYFSGRIKFFETRLPDAPTNLFRQPVAVAAKRGWTAV